MPKAQHRVLAGIKPPNPLIDAIALPAGESLLEPHEIPLELAAALFQFCLDGLERIHGATPWRRRIIPRPAPACIQPARLDPGQIRLLAFALDNPLTIKAV
jgi:hypothetical protein